MATLQTLVVQRRWHCSLDVAASWLIARTCGQSSKIMVKILGALNNRGRLVIRTPNRDPTFEKSPFQAAVDLKAELEHYTTKVLALIGGALARMHPKGFLHLRFVASARDAPGEGSVVADLADSRDLDLALSGTSVEEAVHMIASCVRHRRWRLPDALTDAEERVYINVRPLLQGVGSSSWHHTTQWPPVQGEWNWDRRNVYHALWIMADQVSGVRASQDSRYT